MELTFLAFTHLYNKAHYFCYIKVAKMYRNSLSCDTVFDILHAKYVTVPGKRAPYRAYNDFSV